MMHERNPLKLISPVEIADIAKSNYSPHANSRLNWAFYLAFFVLYKDKLLIMYGLKYPEFQDFEKEYKCFQVLAVDEKNKLWKESNWMRIFYLHFGRKVYSKGLVVSVVPKLIEDLNIHYITGSGQTPGTTCRVYMYEKEGDITGRSPPPQNLSRVSTNLPNAQHRLTNKYANGGYFDIALNSQIPAAAGVRVHDGPGGADGSSAGSSPSSGTSSGVRMVSPVAVIEQIDAKAMGRKDDEGGEIDDEGEEGPLGGGDGSSGDKVKKEKGAATGTGTGTRAGKVTQSLKFTDDILAEVDAKLPQVSQLQLRRQVPRRANANPMYNSAAFKDSQEKAEKAELRRREAERKKRDAAKAKQLREGVNMSGVGVNMFGVGVGTKRGRNDLDYVSGTNVLGSAYFTQTMGISRLVYRTLLDRTAFGANKVTNATDSGPDDFRGPGPGAGAGAGAVAAAFASTPNETESIASAIMSLERNNR